MKQITSLILGLLFIPALLFTQSESEDYSMVELNYMKAKHGHNADFEAAVKVHNDKFHKEGGDHEADLFHIVTGNNSGWYVWAMGPITFTDLDNRPDEGAHNEDWQKNVEPHIAEYGVVEYWRLNEDLSKTSGEEGNMIVVWMMDIESGEYYRFRSFMENIKEVHIDMDDAIEVYSNQFNQGDGKDVALVFPLENWAELDTDEWSMKDEYEKKFGEGSWENGMKEWDDFVKKNRREVWKRLDD